MNGERRGDFLCVRQVRRRRLGLGWGVGVVVGEGVGEGEGGKQVAMVGQGAVDHKREELSLFKSSGNFIWDC